jgi:hypothetical protein
MLPLDGYFKRIPIGQKGEQQSLADHTATATALSKEAKHYMSKCIRRHEP